MRRINTSATLERLKLLSKAASESDGELNVDTLIRREQPDHVTDALRAACAFRRFNMEALKIALRDPTADAQEALSILIDRRLVEKIPNSDSWYWANERASESISDFWSLFSGAEQNETDNDYDSWRELNRQLADYYKSLGDLYALEYLHHLLIADPQSALQLLTQLVEECLPGAIENKDGAQPSQFDKTRGIALARARDVLDVYDRQKKHGGTSIGGIVGRFKVLTAHKKIQAWEFWEDSWRRSQRYVERPTVQKWFVDILRPDSHNRFLEIHAPGGRGKTMSLRWLIAHHCLPRAIPIAHLDFDDLSGEAAKTPLSLLMACVSQLDKQMVGSPFHSLLESVQETLPEDFCQIIERRSEPVIVLIIDTFEEAMLRRSPSYVTEFFTLLSRCVSGSDKLRVVLCGRYRCEKRYAKHFAEEPGLQQCAEVFATVKKTYELPLLDQGEIEDFFELRQITMETETLDYIVEKSAGSPFHLSLYADILQNQSSKKGLSKEDLASYGDVNLIYLIERVVSRIGSVGVRWLLRYGVVPRELTLDFAEQVIAPQISRVHTNELTDDAPQNDLSSLPKHLQREQLYKTDTALLDETGIEALWRGLRQYASDSSWVKEPVYREGALRFHPCVIEPMRKLLRRYAVLRQIHLRAIDYFDRRAKNAIKGKQRLEAQRESIYHRFQAHGQEAEAYFLSLLEDYVSQNDHKSSYSLAVELLCESYLDGDNVPLEWANGDKIVSELAVYRARMQAALSALNLALVSANDRHRKQKSINNAREHLAELPQLVNNVFSSEQKKIWECCLTLISSENSTEREEAVAFLRGSVSHQKNDETQNLCLRALAATPCGREDYSVVTLCAKLFRALSKSSSHLTEVDAQLFSDGARHLRLFGGEPAEYGVFASHFQSFLDQKDDACLSLVVPTMARLLTYCGRGEEARKLLNELVWSQKNTSHNSVYVEKIRAILATQGPAEIIDASLPVPDESGNYWAEHEVTNLKCEAASLLFAFDEVEHHSRRGASSDASAWTQTLEREFLIAQFSLRQLLDPEIVRMRHDEFERSFLQAPAWLRDAFAVRRHLLNWEAAVFFYEPEADIRLAKTQAHDALEQSGRLDDKRLFALTAIRLSYSDDQVDIEPYLKQLNDMLARLPDAVARAGALSDFLHDDFLPCGNQLQYATMHGQLDDTSSPFGPAEPIDKAVASLCIAATFRSTHHPLRAIEPLIDAASVLTKDHLYYWLPDVWRLDAVVKASDAAHPDNMMFFFHIEKAHNFFLERAPNYASLIALEFVERALQSSDLETATNWLNVSSLNDLDNERQPSQLSARLRYARHQYDLLRSGEPVRSANVAEPAAATVVSETTPVDVAPATVFKFNNEAAQTLLKRSEADGSVELATIEFEPNTVPLSIQQTESYDRIRWMLPETASSPFAREALGRLSDSLEDVLADWYSVFFSPLFDSSLTDHPQDVCISTRASHFASAPWELLIHAERLKRNSGAAQWRTWYRSQLNKRSEHFHRVQWLQRALAAENPANHSMAIDGKWGPVSQLAYNAAATSLGTNNREDIYTHLRQRLSEAESQSPFRLQVAVLQPAQEEQFESQRGLTYGGHQLEYVYGDCDVDVLYDVTLENFDEAWGPRPPPNIIHVYAPYGQDGDSGHFGPLMGQSNKRKTRMTKGKKMRSRSGPTSSLVILDGPAEPSIWVQVQQILYRNAYANDLFRKGEYPSILALGLDSEPHLEFFDSLKYQICSGASVSEIYNRYLHYFRNNTLINLDTHGSLAAALWTCDPHISVSRDIQGDKR